MNLVKLGRQIVNLDLLVEADIDREHGIVDLVFAAPSSSNTGIRHLRVKGKRAEALLRYLDGAAAPELSEADDDTPRRSGVPVAGGSHSIPSF